MTKMINPFVRPNVQKPVPHRTKAFAAHAESKLQNKPFCASSEFLKIMQRFGQTIDVSAGTILFRAGEPTRGVYIVIAGKLALWSGDDPVRITRIAERGCLLGLPATVRKRPYSLSAEAVMEATVCLVGPDQFGKLISDHPLIGQETLVMLADEVSSLRRLAVYEIASTLPRS